jgi:hypothetical protein
VYSDDRVCPISRGTAPPVGLLIGLNCTINQRGGEVSLRKGPMNIVLQSKENSAFVENLGGTWTKDREHAHVFASGLDALVFCFKLRLNNMQMVATFLDPRMDFSVPVADAHAR